MSAARAQKPVSVSSSLHDREVVTVDAIRALDDPREIRLSRRRHCTVTCAVDVLDPRVAVMVDAPLVKPDTSPV